MFLAYVSPIYNQGLNVGGILTTEEVAICDCCCDCSGGNDSCGSSYVISGGQLAANIINSLSKGNRKIMDN